MLMDKITVFVIFLLGLATLGLISYFWRIWQARMTAPDDYRANKRWYYALGAVFTVELCSTAMILWYMVMNYMGLFWFFYVALFSIKALILFFFFRLTYWGRIAIINFAKLGLLYVAMCVLSGFVTFLRFPLSAKFSLGVLYGAALLLSILLYNIFLIRFLYHPKIREIYGCSW